MENATRTLVLMTLLTSACGDMAAAPVPETAPERVLGAEACDPLAAVALPVKLGKVDGVGRDAAGTVYLIDEGMGSSSGMRLFTGREAVLSRQMVSGSAGEGSGPGSRILVTSEDAGGLFHVEIEMGDAGAARMGLLRGPLPKTKTFPVGVEGDTLEVLPASTVDRYRLENLPGTSSVNHLGWLADGRRVVVTAPDVDTRYDDFRVFFGPLEHLDERPVTGVAVGSYSSITFTAEGHEVKAVFGSPLNTFVTSTLTIDGQSEPLMTGDEPGRPAGATFYCLQAK